MSAAASQAQGDSHEHSAARSHGGKPPNGPNGVAAGRIMARGDALMKSMGLSPGQAERVLNSGRLPQQAALAARAYLAAFQQRLERSHPGLHRAGRRRPAPGRRFI